jgi:N-acetylmuramoyl-L-alanine amidase
VAAALAALGILAGASACGRSDAPAAGDHAPNRSSPTPTRSTPATALPTASGPSPVTRSPASTHRATPPAGGPVIVIDPGHSPRIHAVDPATGLDVSDYENEPEMRDVFAVAVLVRAKLRRAGYQVIVTKSRVDARASLGQRAAIADSAHAALALSIHDQAGPDGGIPFASGNNTVYYQSVGTYRATSSGRRVYFTDRAVAARGARYGQIFRDERTRVEGHHVRLQGDVGYDLGTRGLPAGDIWLVQLLAHVPWIYNEAGGNSPGMSGLDTADERRYADGLVAAVERCVPVRR